ALHSQIAIAQPHAHVDPETVGDAQGRGVACKRGARGVGQNGRNRHPAGEEHQVFADEPAVEDAAGRAAAVAAAALAVAATAGGAAAHWGGDGGGRGGGAGRAVGGDHG